MPKINEPFAPRRTVTVQLTNAGVPVNGAILGTNAQVLIAKYGGTMGASAGATLTPITGGAQTDGLYDLTFAAADCSVVGPLKYEITPTASLVFQGCTGSIDIEPLDCLYYGLVSSVVSSTVLQLTSPILTAGYYASASSGRVALVRVVAGTGLNQARLVTDYNVVSGNGQATLDSAFTTGLDTTSIVRIEQVIPTAELSTDARLAQLVGLIASIAAIPTDPLLTTDARLNNLDAKLSSIIAAAGVLQVTTPQPQDWGIVSGDYGAEYPMPITVVGYGGVVNLTTASSYQLRWLQPNGTVVTVSLTAVGLAAGQIERIWVSGDTSQVGVHRGQVVVTWPDSTTTTYPQDGSYYTWNVFPVLAKGAL